MRYNLTADSDIGSLEGSVEISPLQDAANLRRKLNGGCKVMVKRTLSSGGYEAEFFSDRSASVGVVHYVVTRKGSSEILAWGQEKTAQEARRAALDCMHDLYQNAMGQASAG